MEPWNHHNQGASAAQSVNGHMGHSLQQPKEEVHYMMRQVTDGVRFAMCDAISQRPLLWDHSREKCSSQIRKNLLAEVVDIINQQFVLNPPITLDELEKHWKNLKDTYIKTRRKLTYDNVGCLIPPKWKYFNAMTFLETNRQPPDFVGKKRASVHMDQFPTSSYELYQDIPAKKEKLDELPSDEYMEFCRSLYLPLKEIGYKDRIHWLKVQKTIRDIIFEAQIESVTKAPPDMQ